MKYLSWIYGFTWCAFSSASDVNASSVNVTVFTASSQISWQSHLEEIVSCVDAMIGQMKNTAKMINSSLGLSQCYFSWFCAGSHMKFSIPCCTTLRVSWHELSHSWWVSNGILLELNFWYDDWICQDTPAICANYDNIQRVRKLISNWWQELTFIASCTVDFNLITITVWTLLHFG